MVATKQSLTIKILEDEEDILDLFGDYLSAQGHRVLNKYANVETILLEIDIECPDVYIIDYLLRGNNNGIDVACEILKKFPLSSILFVTGFELLNDEISKNEIFNEKNIDILIKPIRLVKLEDSLLNLVCTK